MIPLLPRFVLVLVLELVLGACEVKNRDHCLHKSDTPDAWCAGNVPERGYCSPCASAEKDHGCVAAPPLECADYQPDGGFDSGTGTTASSGEATTSSGDGSSTSSG
jgi:hypothetical protein